MRMIVPVVQSECDQKKVPSPLRRRGFLARPEVGPPGRAAASSSKASWRHEARINLGVQVCQRSTVQAQGGRGCTRLAMDHRPGLRRQSACREFLVVQTRLRLAALPNACEYARMSVRACMCMYVGCAAPAGETAPKTMQHRPLEHESEHRRASAPARG